MTEELLKVGELSETIVAVTHFNRYWSWRKWRWEPRKVMIFTQHGIYEYQPEKKKSTS